MRVLCVSGELISGDLAYRLQQEGCEVKLFIEHSGQKNCLNGLVQKTDDWKEELDWVGKEGLIVFDDVGYGKEQDALREQGYSVLGGSHGGDLLELDRGHGQAILRSSCEQYPNEFETHEFDIGDAVDFVQKNGGEWVVKQDDHDNSLNYVGSVEDGSDVISILEHYKATFGANHRVVLQRRVRGIEIAVGRFFNGFDWVGPAVVNVEHKHLCNDDIGPLGGETGTVMWFDAEGGPLFRRILAGLKTHLQCVGYRGYIDVNCIISGENVYPLELTSRFGSSTIQTQREIMLSPWSEFLIAIAKGQDYDLKYKKDGYGLNVALTVAPFPYRTSDKSITQEGAGIFFRENMSSDDLEHLHFEGVQKRVINGKSAYCVAGDLGYVLYVTGFDASIDRAREKVYSLIDRIIIPKMFYRTDIGLRFANKDYQILKASNWI
jgi:phosphoribosylamine---glycine ligase